MAWNKARTVVILVDSLLEASQTVVQTADMVSFTVITTDYRVRVEPVRESTQPGSA